MTRTPIPVPKPTRRPKDRKAVMLERSADQRAYRIAHPTCEVRIALLDRYGNVLVTSLCNEQATEVHHLVPRGMGGSSEAFVHSDEDKMSVCRPHHRMIELHRFL